MFNQLYKQSEIYNSNLMFDILSLIIFCIQYSILSSQLYKQSDIYKLGKTVQEIISVERTVGRKA